MSSGSSFLGYSMIQDVSRPVEIANYNNIMDDANTLARLYYYGEIAKRGYAPDMKKNIQPFHKKGGRTQCGGFYDIMPKPYNMSKVYGSEKRIL